MYDCAIHQLINMELHKYNKHDTRHRSLLSQSHSVISIFKPGINHSTPAQEDHQTRPKTESYFELCPDPLS